MHRLSEHGRHLEYISKQFKQSPYQGNSLEAVEAANEPLLVDTFRGDHIPSEGSNEGRDTIVARRLSIGQITAASSNIPKAYSTLRVRASHYRRSSCEGWCSCICHTPSYFRTPQSVDFLLGSLFMGYSGLPVRNRACNERTCRKQSIPTVKVTYHFPHWLLARMIHFVLTLSYMKGPGVSLSMPRVIPDNAPVLTFAVQGNLDGIKSLFSKGTASPYDVALSNGRTALHVSLKNA